MRTLSNIIITFATLILLFFGSGGVGITRCACSGKLSLANPMERNCCPVESDCMTVTVIHFSAGVIQNNDDLPHHQPIELLMMPSIHQVFHANVLDICCYTLADSPPDHHLCTTVLRV